ncbi:hypothetical protein [Leptospira bandrabouensis]|uniref:Lipoprotein n=1 Tax=Leptospira bandrabouensis TaxID=2484903 RepID=A0A6H3NY81_9LEPT|nr:hypothetical protein [Leptospira bandrabouensis]MCG6144072.1 hypothetical protein [Leptospira bandrabouensis]MCG6150887.1 hypothetical protein [Leptospira bandrabouensis]MCG6159733.1 hypothetical protein [Leptospira bandrabouensis]MCG6163666.1 hypothetical protein [Leptospira bandrabouensis]MCW7457584.1 hypothetical protein [Leptospira bandrabouensis]
MKKLIFILINLSLISCDRDNWRDQMEEENQKVILQIKNDQKQIELNRLNQKDWNQSSKSKELAIKNFLTEISNTGKPTSYYVSWDEKMEVLFPNVLGYGTMLDSTPLTEYKKMLDIREEMAIKEIAKLIYEKKFQITSIDWDDPKDYRNLKAYKPKSIQLKIDKNLYELKQIKMVFQTTTGYKVGVLAP